jgi:hypothetical protein
VQADYAIVMASADRGPGHAAVTTPRALSLRLRENGERALPMNNQLQEYETMQRFGTDSLVQRAGGLALAGLLGVFALQASAAGRGSQAIGNCTRTALAAHKAARQEAQADFWNEVGNCLNLSDFGAILDCIEDARDELEEAFEEADEQFEARLDLCGELGDGPYDPVIDPLRFTSVVTNPFFPLVPGTTLVYEGVTSEGLERVEGTTLAETREIQGVDCAVVHCVAYLEGEVVEDTFDYYAQDNEGNVWYFGELSFELEDGYIVNMSGSFIGGVDGAKPGIIMLAAPSPGKVYRQEWALNEAEDIGTFLATGATVHVPYNGGTTFLDCWQIQDTSPLEPDALEHKFYAKGVGLVQEVDVDSGEHLDLVDILVD